MRMRLLALLILALATPSLAADSPLYAEFTANGEAWLLALLGALATACASTVPAREAGAEPQCWTLSGTGAIGETPDGYLCLRLRDAECLRCTTLPPGPPPEAEL